MKRREHFHRAYEDCLMQDEMFDVEEQDEVLTKLRREEETEEERKARVKENIERKNRNKERREKRRMIEEAKKEEVVVEGEVKMEGQDQEKLEEVEEDEEEDIYIPQPEYTTVCNADFAPLICNEFVSEFLDKEHGAC